jgi:hypothetical protein
MNEIERAIIVALNSTAEFALSLAKSQEIACKLLAEKLPDLSDPERKDLLKATEALRAGTQGFSESVQKLKDLV